MALTEYALVVGVEDYASSRVRPLQGPSLDAMRFALWLRRKRGLPSSNIILLHNKCAKWKGELEEEYTRVSQDLRGEGVSSLGLPTFDRVGSAWQKELLSLCPKAGKARLWVYWSGHGVMISDDGQAFFCSDVTHLDEPQVIYASELREGLHTQPFVRFSPQWLIFDACSSYLKSDQLFLISHRRPENYPAKHSATQALLQAVPEYEGAVQHEGASPFTSALLDVLNTAPQLADDADGLWRAVTKSIEDKTGDPRKWPRLVIDAPGFNKQWPPGPAHLTFQIDAIGVVGLPESQAADVQAFVDLYLEPADGVAAFGGRDAMLEHVTKWLFDQQSSRNLFICAPAGMGKSALIIHWLRQLYQSKADVEVVFFPISSRFATTSSRGFVLQALAAQIEARHGEPFQPKPDPDAHRAAFHKLLQQPLPSGRKLLIAVDGLDEAIGWDASAGLFPLRTAPNVKILASARQYGGERSQAWLTRLKWSATTPVIELAPLGLDGVRYALSSVAEPLGPYGVDLDALAARLTELTENGDPLLLYFYIQEVCERAAAGGSGSLQFEHTPNGLRGLYQEWLDKQREIWGSDKLLESHVAALLAACACSKGPLMRSDVRGVAPKIFDSAEKVISAVNASRRFVIGDGLRTGFMLSHPRLREFFRDERLDESDRKLWAQRFLLYMKREASKIRKGNVGPADASRYVSRSYLLHLKDSQYRPEDLIPVLSREWFDVSEKLEGTPERFSRDMQLAAEMSSALGKDGLPTLIRAALMQSSAETATNNIGEDLFTECLKAGIISPTLGLVIARRQTNAKGRVEFMVRLADAVEEPDRGRILNEALSAARSIEEEGTDPKAEALAEIAERLFEGQQKEDLIRETLDAARDATHSMTTASVLIRILAILPPNQRLAIGREAAQVCLDTLHNSKWFCARKLVRLWALVPDSAESREWLSLGVNIARAMESGSTKCSTLIGVAEHVSGNSRAELLEEALQEAEQASDLDWKVHNLIALVRLLSEERRTRAIDALKEIRESLGLDGGARVKLTCVLAQHSTPSERGRLIEEALQLAGSFADGPERRAFTSNGPKKAWALRLIASVVQEPQRSELLTGALAASRMINDGAVRVSGLAALVRRLPDTEREAFVEDMNSMIRVSHEPVERCEARCELIPSLPTAVRRLSIAEAISDACQIQSYKRENALANIARQVRSSEELALLMQAAREQVRPLHSDVLVRALAESLDTLEPPADENLKSEVLQLMLAAPSSANAAIAAANMAHHVKGKTRDALIAKALMFAEQVAHHPSRVEAMAEIAEEIAKLQQQAAEAGEEALRVRMTPPVLRRVALDLANGIADPSSSAQAFVALAVRVDEPLRRELLNKAKEEAFRVDEERQWERAQALASVAEHLRAQECSPLLDELPKLLGYHGFDRLLAALSRYWEAICRVRNVAPVEELGKLIRELGNYDRRMLILGVAALAPAIESIGGANLARQTAETIVKAGQSWP
jgi:hypothetical protein